jgi:hypothetical protein
MPNTKKTNNSGRSKKNRTTRKQSSGQFQKRNAMNQHGNMKDEGNSNPGMSSRS